METCPDAAVVVRGGQFPNPEDVLDSILDAIDLGDGPVLSVFVADPAQHGGQPEAIRHACAEGQVPHGKVRFTTVGMVRALGLELVLDTSKGQANCHHHLVFPDDPTIVEVERLVDCFSEPIPNPAKESRS